MAFRSSTNLSASASASRSRGTFRRLCYRDLQHFAVELLSKRDPPKKDCMSLFIGKEDQHSEDRLLANASFKDYIRLREKVATVNWSDARALTTPIKRLRKQNGQDREPY